VWYVNPSPSLSNSSLVHIALVFLLLQSGMESILGGSADEKKSRLKCFENIEPEEVRAVLICALRQLFEIALLPS